MLQSNLLAAVSERGWQRGDDDHDHDRDRDHPHPTAILPHSTIVVAICCPLSSHSPPSPLLSQPASSRCVRANSRPAAVPACANPSVHIHGLISHTHTLSSARPFWTAALFRLWSCCIEADGVQCGRIYRCPLRARAQLRRPLDVNTC